MGEWFDFEIKINEDGTEVFGYEYCTEATGWQPVFVPMTQDQMNMANDFHDKLFALYQEKNELIKGWVEGK